MSCAKSPIWAWAPDGAGLSLSPSQSAPCTGHNSPAWSLNYPFVESDFVLCCWQQSLTLNVTAYFTAMKKSLCSAGSLFLGVSGQPLGEVFRWFIPRVPHLCPRLYASLHPRPWVFLSLIPPSFYHSSPGAQSPSSFSREVALAVCPSPYGPSLGVTSSIPVVGRQQVHLCLQCPGPCDLSSLCLGQ